MKKKLRIREWGLIALLCLAACSPLHGAPDGKFPSARAKRIFLSGPNPPGNEGAYSEGEMSPTTAELLTFFHGYDDEFKMAQKISEHEKERPGFTEELRRLLDGWTLPFDDYLHREYWRILFSSFDIRLKTATALALWKQSSGRGNDETARALFEQGVALIRGLNDEFEHCDLKAMREELKAQSSAIRRNDDIRLNRKCFFFHRQERLKNAQYLWLNEFLEGFERFCGNDIEANLRLCSMAGVRGKIDLTRHRRPELSEEAIEQYERRNGRNSK